VLMRTISPSGRCNSIQPFTPVLRDEQSFPNAPLSQAKGRLGRPSTSASSTAAAAIFVRMAFTPAADFAGVNDGQIG
jgi:hypothetical protein